MATKEVVDPVTGEVREIPDDPRRRYEYPSSTRIAPPIGFKQQPSMWEVMRQMIKQHHLEQELAAQGLESPEEADDFDVPDDDDPVDKRTPYEHNFDPPASPEAIQEEAEKVSKVKPPKKVKAPPEAPPDAPPPPPEAANGNEE